MNATVDSVAKMTKQEAADSFLARILFRIHGLVERVLTAVTELKSAPHDRGPVDFENRYTEEEMHFLTGIAAQNARRSYGGIHNNGSNINTIMLTILTVVIIPGGAWIIGTLIDHGKELAQIHCQLSPANCLQLQVPHGK